MQTEDNPWKTLAGDGEYVLGGDRPSIRRYNELVIDDRRKVLVRSIPEPFIGDPKTARIVLLNLNPGHSDADIHWHRNHEFKNAMFCNLRHEKQDYPFYPLNPSFEGNGAGEWWHSRTRELRESSGLDLKSFAQKLLVVEWFPYHTKKSPSRTKQTCRPDGTICKSQDYSFQLVRTLSTKPGVVVVGMRSKNLWLAADKNFKEIPFLKNPQCGYVSRGNSDASLFAKMLNALKQ